MTHLTAARFTAMLTFLLTFLLLAFGLAGRVDMEAAEATAALVAETERSVNASRRVVDSTADVGADQLAAIANGLVSVVNLPLRTDQENCR